MPGYRNPDLPRIQAQAQTVFQYAGQTATWRQVVGSATGMSVMGRGAVLTYREQPITALFQPLPSNPEMQSPAGMIAADQFQVTTFQQLGRADELRWKGDVYSVESDPSPATMPGYWVCQVKRRAP